MRDRILEIIIYCLLSVLLYGFFTIQIINGPKYRAISENNRIRTIPVVSARGRIYDRNGQVLADNKHIFNVSVIPEDFDVRYIDQLADILELDHKAIDEKIRGLQQGRNRAQPVLVKQDIGLTSVYRLEELSTMVGGILLEEDSLRSYPLGEVACHVVGYIGKINQDEYQAHKHQGWLINDYVGRLGIEKTCNDELMGKPGGRQFEVNARGERLRVLSEKDPVIGKDIYITLDSELQSRITGMVDRAQTVSVCVMDVHNGEIVALVSTPLFDPNYFLAQDKGEERMAALQDSRQLFVNRPISFAYAPGSIFKVLVGIAGLQEGVITPDTTYKCEGSYQINEKSRPFKCWNPYGHGDIALPKAIERSCNVYFYRLGLALGNARIARYARMFGFGQSVELGLPYSRAGLVPDALWKRAKLHERWYPGETINYSIGQGFLEVTPLQVAKMIGAIANGGTLFEPHIIQESDVSGVKLPIDPKNFAIMRGAMLRAIESEYGTAHAAQPKYFKMAGKTGTAQNRGEPHSWYAGFFPYDQPEIALVVMAEHAGVGGGVAARYAGQIADEWMKLKNERQSDQGRKSA